MSWTYTENRRGTGEYLNHDLGLREELHRRAHLGLSVATALAPRRTGDLARSGHVEDDGPHHGFRQDRMQVSIVFNIGYAVPASYRTKWHVEAASYLRAAIPVIEAGA